MYNDETDRYTSALYSLSPDMPREDWITIALAFSDAVPGDAGFIVFDQWSQAGSTYKPVDTKAVWKSCKPEKVKAGTLIHSAKAVGWEWTGERPTFAPPTAEELQARQLQEQQAAREAEAKLVEASKKARAVIGAARAARADHPYLISKGVGIDANLRELPVEQIAERLRYHPQSSGQPLQGRVVIATIQLIENGYLQTSSIEMIDEAGRKTAMAGGKKKDGFTTLGTIPRGGKRIYLCEGIATGLSIREATREPVICALSCGNLLSVAQTMKAQYPTCQILVAAELNKETGLPEPHANDAALVVGGAVAIPVFSGAREPGQTDFNDMHHAEGIKAVRASLSAPTEPAVPDTSLSDIAQDVRLEDGPPPVRRQLGWPV